MVVPPQSVCKVLTTSTVRCARRHRYRCIENSMLAISIGKAMDFVLLGVGPMDFYNGNRKMILAFWWQLMRYHTLKLVSSLGADGFEVSEGDILDWANERVDDAGYADLRLRSFKVWTPHAAQAPYHDGWHRRRCRCFANSANSCTWVNGGAQDSSVKTSHFLLRLLHSVRPIVNWSVVTPGNSEDERAKNAQYVPPPLRPRWPHRSPLTLCWLRQQIRRFYRSRGGRDRVLVVGGHCGGQREDDHDPGSRHHEGDDAGGRGRGRRHVRRRLWR